MLYAYIDGVALMISWIFLPFSRKEIRIYNSLVFDNGNFSFLKLITFYSNDIVTKTYKTFSVITYPCHDQPDLGLPDNY